MMHS